MKTVQIHVTLDDLTAGVVNACEDCPVALAMRRALKTDEVNVKYDVFWLGRKQYRLPKEVTDFIIGFDAGILVKPFSFTVTVD